MHHVLNHQVMKIRVNIVMWDLSSDDAINLLWLYFIEKPQKNVNVWKTAFLPFYSEHPASDSTEDMAFGDNGDKSLYFWLKTRATISCLSEAFFRGSSSQIISSHFGLQVI